MFNLFNNNPESENAEVKTDLQKEDLEEHEFLQNRIRELEEQFTEQEDKTNKYKQKYNKTKQKKEDLKRQLKKKIQENLLKLNDGIIESLELSEIIDIDVYEDQRIIYQTHVDKIKKHQIKFFEINQYFDLPQCLIIARQKEKKEDFLNKQGDRVIEILIDGQHRITAFKQILKEQPQNYSVYSKAEIPVKTINLETMEDVKKKFRDIHKAKPLTHADKKVGKRQYNGSEIISKLKRRFLTKKVEIISIKYNGIETKEDRTNRKDTFYYEVFATKLSNHERFQNFMSKKSLKREELEELFVNFNKKIFINLSKINFEIIRKRVKLRIGGTKYSRNLQENLSKYKKNQSEKHVTFAIGIEYPCMYDNLVSHFYKFCIKEMDYVEKVEDEFYDEESDEEESEDEDFEEDFEEDSSEYSSQF